MAIKSECSDKEKYEINLTSLGFLLPEDTGRYKYDKGVEKLSDNVIKNMSKLWSNINKNYYKIKKYLERSSIRRRRFGEHTANISSTDVF